MKSAVIVFPGSNCDRDVAVALKNATGKSPFMVWHRETVLPDVDLVVVPGGFSYGDYLRSGAMAARSPIMRAVSQAAAEDRVVLGICNGFQVLVEAGLLPGALMRNATLRYISKNIPLRVERSDTCFTRAYAAEQVIRLPIAHNDGNYFADDETIERLDNDGRIILRYCSDDGTVDEDGNPNGSRDNIAGIVSENRRVLGLMPHPERAVDDDHGGTDGQPLFQGLLEALT